MYVSNREEHKAARGVKKVRGEKLPTADVIGQYQALGDEVHLVANGSVRVSAGRFLSYLVLVLVASAIAGLYALFAYNSLAAMALGFTAPIVLALLLVKLGNFRRMQRARRAPYGN